MTGFASFQCVAFLAGFAPAPDASGLWSRAFPGLPYNNFKRPAPGISVVEGVVGTLTYEIQHHSGRIDLIARPEPELAGVLGTVDKLTDLSQPALSALQALVDGSTLTRISAVSTKLTPIQSPTGARAVLEAKVPGLPISDEATDISFQLNVTRKSDIQDGLVINRLCRWSTSFSFEVEFKVLPNGQTVQTPGRLSHFVEEFFDVNTNAEQRVDAASVQAIFGELISETEYLSDRGIARLVG